MAATSNDESRSGDLYQVLRWNLGSVRSLPSPEYPWPWHTVVGTGDGDVHPRLAEKLKDRGGIVPADRDGYWETTRRLAEYIEDRFDVDLDAAGQSRLPVDVSPSPIDASHDDGDDDGAIAWEQLDLTGREVTETWRRLTEAERQELYETRVSNGRRGEPTWMRAGAEPEQLPLDAFDSRPTAPGRLARPAGGVYDSPSPA